MAAGRAKETLRYNPRLGLRDFLGGSMNFFNQGIPLGRWFRINVVIHWTFLVYAAYQILPSKTPGIDAMYMGMLFGTVLVHEFGHALSCKAVGGEAHQIILWPLGGIAFVQPPNKAWAWLVTTLCGPLVNAILWPVFYFVTKAVVEHRYGPGSWEDFLTVLRETPRQVNDMHISVRLCYYMWQINKLLLLFNLIPAYPMDGGRILQELLWMALGYGRSLMIAGMVGTVAALGFVAIGAGLVSLPLGNMVLRGPNMMLVVIGILCAMESFRIYRQSQDIQGWRKR